MEHIWGNQKIISIPASSQQPFREPWTMDWLNHEQSILLGLFIDSVTAATYTSTTNLYLTFCKIHHLPIDLTPETLSYYIMFQSHFIGPSSVNSYLLAISNQLDPYYPDIQKYYALPLVRHTMKGAHCSHNRVVQQKLPLTVQNLTFVHDHLDDLLFDVQLSTGFSGLLWLGELVSSDKWDWKKVTMCHTLEWLPVGYLFWLAIRVTSFLRETGSFAGGSQVLLTHYPICSNMLRNTTDCSLSTLSCGCVGMDQCLFIPGGWAICGYSSRTPKLQDNPCVWVVPQPWLKWVPSWT